MSGVEMIAGFAFDLADCRCEQSRVNFYLLSAGAANNVVMRLPG
jgi:hypothetical protein